MPDESYLTWVNIFDKDLTQAYTTERKELKTASMILCALQKEFEKIKTSVHSTYEDLRTELENKDKQVQKKARLGSNTKENTPPLAEPDRTPSIQSISTESSPDFLDDTAFTTVGDTKANFSNETEGFSFNSTPSPTLKMKRKAEKTQFSPSLCFLPSGPKCDTKSPKNDFNESTFIDSTPEVGMKKKSVKSNLFLSKKKLLSSMQKSSTQGNSTLTRFFKKKSKNDTCDDTTTMEITDIINLINEDSNDSEKPESQMSLPASETDMFSKMTGVKKKVDMDATSIVDMDLTNIDYSAKKNNLNFYMDDTSLDDMDLSNRSDAAKENNLNFEANNLNSSEFLSNHGEYESPNKKAKKDFIPVHARKEYVHWECEECKRFYGVLSLSPEMLKKKMGVCTRHKIANKQPDTIPGFWDMSIRTQK
ncbi:unnamed protein product [Brassicogethes aeneus]|uniref:DNA endonuclease RBBP8 n=1 Tax=Brassicogethes aeneus TaxID=1431903 RepID=A0A9P0FJD9_BRAAE|nr:unnamed protein product [Brassicogethes aeneus]